MANFNNVNVPFPQNCGVGTMPGYATFKTDLTCSNAGVGANSQVVPTSTIVASPGPTIPIVRVTVTTTTTVRIGSDLTSEGCVTLMETLAGVTPGSSVPLGDISGAAGNNAWAVFDCFSNASVFQVLVSGQTSGGDDVTAPFGTQVLLNDPCSTCYTSDFDFICVSGCTNKYSASSLWASNSQAVFITLVAGTYKFEFCQCAFERPSMGGCPTPGIAIAQIPTAPLCVPPVAQQVIGQRTF